MSKPGKKSAKEILALEAALKESHASTGNASAWGGDWREGSVSEMSETNTERYWVWPPRA